MALQFEVDSLDGVDEGLQSLYTEHEGKFRLAVEGIDPADELKEALRKEREEAKSYKTKASELEKAQRAAVEEQAKKNGEFEKLWQQEQEERAKLLNEHNEFKTRIQAKDVDSETLKIGTSLTRDTKRAELLAQQAKSFTKYGEEGVYFEIGGIKVDQAKVVEHLTKEYPFLVDGNQATGGGAAGSGSGASGVKTATRAEFEKMSDGDRMAFTKDGGKVTAE